ncbi:hypothetical protein Droror1_Dr00019547 [Drosera rotundifolia]
MKTFTRRKDAAAATMINPHQSDDNTTTQKQHHINGQSIVLVMPSQSPLKKKKKTEKEKKSEDEVTKKKKRKKESEVKEENDGETVKRGKAEEGEGAAASGFPVSRVDRIVRSEGSSEYRITSEAVFLIKNATEKFLEAFSADSYASAIRDRKKSLGYKHLTTVVSKEKRFDFLSDFVPEKVKAEKALSEMKLSGTSPG